MKLINKTNLFSLLALLVYSFLTLLCVNNVYFWDNIQQVSKEAHWFYLTDFRSLLMPAQNSGADIVATGYHPPLMGIMTAALWEIFQYKIWVSHLFVFVWAIILIYNLQKITRFLFPEKFAGWVLLIILMESTLLAQFSIASPDFILFTAFVISLRAILERKSILLSIGVFFLCCINMRGIFVGAILFFVNCFYNYLQSDKKFDIRIFSKTILPYLPTLLLLVTYYINYFIARGWFFSDSSNNGHYTLPAGFARVIKHFAEFGLRSLENGRIIIWLIGTYVAYKTFKSKTTLSDHTKALLLFFLLLTGLYVLFIFITQMPFSARYFMPQFFLLTILGLLGITKFLPERKITIVFALVLCFELTGHFWIYPDKIAKSWDCTLAHLPYYELREDCFKYIDAEKMDYNDISAGFCLYGNREYIEMKKDGKTIGSDSNRKYFIYSNISNVEDSLAEELQNPIHWMPIKKFEKGLVFITVYKQMLCDNKVQK